MLHQLKVTYLLQVVCYNFFSSLSLGLISTLGSPHAISGMVAHRTPSPFATGFSASAQSSTTVSAGLEISNQGKVHIYIKYT